MFRQIVVVCRTVMLFSCIVNLLSVHGTHSFLYDGITLCYPVHGTHSFLTHCYVGWPLQTKMFTPASRDSFLSDLVTVLCINAVVIAVATQPDEGTVLVLHTSSDSPLSRMVKKDAQAVVVNSAYASILYVLSGNLTSSGGSVHRYDAKPKREVTIFMVLTPFSFCHLQYSECERICQ